MLKKLWNYGRNDSMVRDSFLLFSTTMIANVGAFIFHIIMGRLLGTAGYGVLGVLLSLIHLLGVPINALQTVVAKFVAKFKADNEQEKINYLLRKSSVKLLSYAFLGFIVSVIISPFISAFLKISTLNFLLLSPVIIFVAILPVARGAFQGLQRFNMLGLNLFLEILIKLIVGITLVYLGLNVNGAILAVTLSFLFPTLIAVVMLKKYFVKTNETINTKQIYKYSYPVLIAILSLVAILSIDILLVKHFFEESMAGFYAAASLSGKIIYFATLPISQVLFPKSIERQIIKQSTTSILKKGMLLISLVAIPIVVFYFLFPTLVLNILFGKEFVLIYNTLGYNIIFLFGLAIAIFSFDYILVNYNLSIDRTSFIYWLIPATIAEAILIYLFHASLLQVILIVNIVLFLLLLYLSLYTLKSIKWLKYQS